MNFNEDQIYSLAFSYIHSFGPATFHKIVHNFTSIKSAYEAPKSEIAEIVGDKMSEIIITHRKNFDVKKHLKIFEQNNINILTKSDFPIGIKNLKQSPICLFVKGNTAILNYNNLVAIVGTRKPTPYGQQLTQNLSYDLTKLGYNIVSGMALGVDTLAHDACLKAGGQTIAVLACGINEIYPRQNANLYERILQSGAIVSEFPPQTIVKKGMFVLRNRIVAGLSSGVIVTEGALNSGSLTTARYAKEQSKPVFAPPAPLYQEQSEAPNSLLKQGAKLITSATDVAKTLGHQGQIYKIQVDNNLNPTESTIYYQIAKAPQTPDEISMQTQLNIQTVLTTLSIMELKGICQKNSQGLYSALLN